MCGRPVIEPAIRALQRRGIQAQAVQAEPGGALGASAVARTLERVLPAALQGQPPHPQHHAPGGAPLALPTRPLTVGLDRAWLPRLACP